MSKKYPNEIWTICDHGEFVELGIKLSKDVKKLNYFTPWQRGLPKSEQMMLGAGIEGITRVDRLFDVIDETDLFIFSDCYWGDLQHHLLRLGKKVWGSRDGDQLELFRSKAQTYMKSQGLPIGKFTEVEGITALRSELKHKGNEDSWVKCSFTRGDFETFYSKNYSLIEPRLDKLEYTLGAKKSVMRFLIVKNIPDAKEDGYDGWSIDGKFPNIAFCGVETKNKAYALKTCAYTDLPKTIRDVNDKLSKALKTYGYRNFFHTEIREKNGVGYPIDLTCRLGCPPGEIFYELIENLSEIIHEGANGRLVEPKLTGKFGAQIFINSTWAEENLQAVQFPAGIRKNVKLRNLTVIDQKYYVIPQHLEDPAVGAVVAVGNTMKEAARKCKKYAEQVEGFGIEVSVDALDEATEELFN